MKVIYQLNRDHIKQLYDLYQNEWWSKGRTLEETKICVDSSQICIGLKESLLAHGYSEGNWGKAERDQREIWRWVGE